MEVGECSRCKNKKLINSRYWCSAHNKLINIGDIVLCAYFIKK